MSQYGHTLVKAYHPKCHEEKYYLKGTLNVVIGYNKQGWHFVPQDLCHPSNDWVGKNDLYDAFFPTLTQLRQAIDMVGNIPWSGPSSASVPVKVDGATYKICRIDDEKSYYFPAQFNSIRIEKASGGYTVNGLVVFPNVVPTLVDAVRLLVKHKVVLAQY